MNLRDAAQQLIELGPRAAVFRATWELKGRTGAFVTVPHASGPVTVGPWAHGLQLEDPITVGRSVRDRIGARALAALRSVADAAAAGDILCFGRWVAAFGMPVDWHRHPVSRGRWNAAAPWFRALGDQRPGDVKVAWEAGRFPQAYHLARAATFHPDCRKAYAAALLSQIESFIAGNPPGFGIHWASGQETSHRLIAWIFALHVLLQRCPATAGGEAVIGGALLTGARHIYEHLDYARVVVNNNHLLSEALALFAVGGLLPDAAEAEQWRDAGRRILDREADRQFYSDGGYIQQSHNYHRSVLQSYLWADVFARSLGEAPSACWLRALERSLDFLVAHQNPSDGRLPNYGSNDGALPSVLATCDFSDMRPELQAISVLVRGERIYRPGPWDETTAWLLGVRALDAPVRDVRRASVSFAETGFHVLRGNNEGCFAAFRCGTLKNRFSQIDMLHADVWWRGQNVLVDGGSYQYNGAPKWHDHFMRTASHNTVVVDGRDQMVHYRQFNVLYWTKAALTRFEDHATWAICGGEHYGFRRHAGECVHRREILFLKDDLWIVCDHITGAGSHAARLHWLGGPFEWTTGPAERGLTMRTPEGGFSVVVHDALGQPLEGNVVAGDETIPRGWLSRYYGERVPVPSLEVTLTGRTPLTFVSVLSGTAYDLDVAGDRWRVEAPDAALAFNLAGGSVHGIDVRA